MQKIKLWFSIIRPRTLFASICPVGIGLVLIATWYSSFHVGIAVATMACALALQILSNLVNDYYDFQRGSDKAGRVGPARALAEGTVTLAQMKRACFIDLAIALLLGCYLVWVGGLPILCIGVLAILFAWLYTATRHSLSYLGIADIICFLFYGPIATAGTAYLQCGEMRSLFILGGVACGCIAVCVLATNNIRDIEDDRAAGKRTFPVRFGKRASLIGVAVMLVVAYLSMLLTFFNPIVLLWGPIALLLYIRLLKAKGTEYNLCLFRFGLLNLLYLVVAVVSTFAF